MHAWRLDGVELIVFLEPQPETTNANKEVEGGMLNDGDGILFRALLEH